MRAAAAVGSLLMAAPLVAQDVPTFTTSVEAVYLDVFVTRDGRPVPGLAARDFEVRDNGVKQKVTLARLEEIPIVAVLVFDASSSIAGARLGDLRAAGRALLAGLRPQDEATLVTFSHELRVVVPQAGDRSEPRSAPSTDSSPGVRLRSGTGCTRACGCRSRAAARWSCSSPTGRTT